MDNDKKPSDQRTGGERRQDGDPAYDGPERRKGDRRKDDPAPK